MIGSMTRRPRLPLLPLVAIAAAILAVPARAAEPSLRDVETVRQRMIERWTDVDTLSTDALASLSLDTLRSDGSWPDVDYAHRGRTRWRAVAHLSRVRTMATRLRAKRPGAPADPKLREGAVRAFRYWIEKDFRNPNWWWNEIGVPRTLGPTLLLLGDAVPEDLRAGSLRILQRARLGRGTGQNLVWLTEVALVRASIEQRPEVVAAAFRRIADEVRVSTGEGIQPDFSFHQHGAQLYSGGYGLGFAVDIPRLAALARDTAFAFPPRAVEVITGYLLDGQQWMVRGSTFDHAAVGREITRQGAGQRGRGLAAACDDLVLLGGPRTDELRAFAARIRAEGRGEGLTGHRHFWRSDYTVHRRAGYVASVKMSSRRIRGWEIVNSEGLRSHATADGMQLIYRRGDEYAGMFGAWDWLSIPGATVLQSEATFSGRDARGGSTFAGGVSDGEYGVSALDLVRGSLRARKAWFFFDREIICLGAGIRCDAPDPVRTAIQQSRLRGDVRRSEDGGESESGGTSWVHHDGIGYALPPGARAALDLEAGPRTGSWRAINRSYPDEPCTADLFRLWIDHGPRPRDGTYAYAVVPSIRAEEMEGHRWPVEVLANRPEAQAVRHPDLAIVGLVFYEAGEVGVGAGATVAVSEPCVLLLREGAGELLVAAASPEHREMVLGVTLPGRLRGDGVETTASGSATRCSLDLPGGARAGSSVICRLRRVE